MNNDWNWNEVSDEEFETKRKNETYFRIFHKNGENEIVDFKFWGKNEKEALCILNEFKKDHPNSEYFYSTSGYFLDPSNKRYDTMKEMHEAWKKEPYSAEDRKFDIEKLNEFVEKMDSFSPNRHGILRKLEDDLEELTKKIHDCREKSVALRSKIVSSDLEAMDEKEIDNLVQESMTLDESFYKLQDSEYLLRTKHNISESWSLDSHLLDDLRFNLKKMIEDENCGYPNFCTIEAARDLNLEISKNGEAKDESKTKELSQKANDIWKQSLTELLNHVLAYFYFISYGIIDEKDEDLLEFDKLHSNEIPRIEGTDGNIDYEKNYEICQLHWNAIFDWLKEKGQHLWS